MSNQPAAARPDPSCTVLPLHLTRPEGAWRAWLGILAPPGRGLPADPGTFLNGAERAVYEAFAHPGRRQAHLAGRYLAKQVLGAYLGEAHPERIGIGVGVFGQPLVAYPGDPAAAVSIAHAHGWAAALAFHAGHPMGVDLERVTPGAKAVIAPQATGYERRLYQPGEEEEAVFYTRLWTVKEALSKVLRTGLLTPLQLFEVEAIHRVPGGTESTFRNFMQYKALSFACKDQICTLVLPRNSDCQLPEELLRVGSVFPE
ncbi:MAG TPA: 4'-phosphopantetheinyl transferase superfamily protein [Cytophagales bacterium]